jgi:hypothetical protein
MMQEPMRMSFDEFARQLRAVFDTLAQRGEKVVVEKEGLLFRLEPEKAPKKPDLWTDYDPQRVRQGLKSSAGALAGVDRDALQKDIHRQRQQDSQGRPA